MAQSVYREFHYAHTPDHHVGSIQVNCLSGNAFYVTVDGLHENYPLEYAAGHAYLDITTETDPPMDRYDAIMAILDTITEDHRYVLRDVIYQDYMLCTDDFQHPQLSQSEVPYMGGAWVPFTRDTVTHLQINPSWLCGVQPTRVLHGHLTWANDRIVLNYDAPIIGSSMCSRYYALTRGKRVDEVRYKDMYPNPEYERAIGYIYRDVVSDHDVRGVKIYAPSYHELWVEITTHHGTLTRTQWTLDHEPEPESNPDFYTLINTVLDHAVDSASATCLDYVQCSENFHEIDPRECHKYRDMDIAGDQYVLGNGWFVFHDQVFQYMVVSEHHMPRPPWVNHERGRISRPDADAYGHWNLELTPSSGTSTA